MSLRNTFLIVLKLSFWYVDFAVHPNQILVDETIVRLYAYTFQNNQDEQMDDYGVGVFFPLNFAVSLVL